MREYRGATTMKQKLCNRCGNEERPKFTAELSLTGGTVDVTATLCQSCYQDMMEAYDDGE